MLSVCPPNLVFQPLDWFERNTVKPTERQLNTLRTLCYPESEFRWAIEILMACSPCTSQS